MRRRLPAGLRWRLLLALIATSAITLAVAALVVLQPLQSRLRDQSAENLVSAVVAARQGFSLDLARKGVDREIDVAGDHIRRCGIDAHEPVDGVGVVVEDA